MHRAKTRQTIRQAKRLSWQTYVSGLNCRTNIKKAWDMVRKINGSCSQNVIKHLTKNNVLITDVKDIANTLGQNFAHNSSNNNYTPEFQQYKQSREHHPINFTSKNTEPYNMLLTMEELNNALQSTQDSSPGSDEIHYQFLKHLPDTSLLLLLNIFRMFGQVVLFRQVGNKQLLLPSPNRARTTLIQTATAPLLLPVAFVRQWNAL